ERLDRVLRRLERTLFHEHLLGRVLRRPRMMLDRRLELRGDPGLVEDRLQFLRLRDVLRERDLHELGHQGTASSGSGSVIASRLRRTAPLTRCGIPRSGNGTSITSKSFGTTVSGKIVRASRAISGPKYRFDRCVSASSETSASRASSAASSAVECAVSRARSRSSSRNVASWTSTSASRAASRTIGEGAVSPAMTSFRPGRGGPSTPSGVTTTPSRSSTSPTVERSICRCVPSAQSKSSRSPPRRASRAVGARWAVGTEPEVPKNTRSRSTGASVGSPPVEIPPAVASEQAREQLRRDVDPQLYEEIRELWKRHSIAEEHRDLPGLIATLADDCVYEIPAWNQ